MVRCSSKAERPTWRRMRMKGVARVAIGSALAASICVIGPTGPVVADAGPKPRIVGAQWLTAPLNSGVAELLEIRAGDPDGVISRINVFWGDGSFTHADLICFEVGKIATVRLDHEYEAPGRYVARVTAVSSPQCFGPSDQFSPKKLVRSLVEP
jgi:hypothetical protein